MKKLAIVCRAPSTEMLAPFSDADYDIWCLAWCIDRYPRVSAAFEIHESLDHQPSDYVDNLVSRGVQLFVGSGFPADAPHVSRFPFDDAAALMGWQYLTSSAAYMMAMAILSGYEHIELYGVDMAVDDEEYFRQRPCMEAWIGYAIGRGIKVIIPEQSPLMKSSYLYGSQAAPDLGIFTKDAFIEMAAQHRGRIQVIQNKITAMEMEMAAHNGAAQAYDKMAETARAVADGQKITSLKDGVMLK